jgi:hypothetical protein
MKIQHVAIEHVNQTWALVEPYLKAAIESQPGEKDYSIEDVKVYVTLGNWVLLVAVDENVIKGAAVVNFFNRPSHRVAFVTHIGGRLVCNTDTFEQLRSLLQSFGATRIEGAVSESIARLWRRFGFEEKYTVAGVTLK